MRVVRFLVALLVLLAVGALGAFLWYRVASQPLHEGTMIVTGLSRPVSIARDAVAVPYIDAETEADALFALGFVHAQDRLWQMTFNRRVAQGRIAEIAGPAALETDKFMRTLGIDRTARAIAQRLDPETRTLMLAYAAGVNASLAQRSGPLPPEFLFARAPAPEPWQVSDSIAWALMMALDLSRTYRDELTRLRLASHLPRAEIDELKPPYPGAAPPEIADYPTIYRALGVYRPGDARRSGTRPDASTERAASRPKAGTDALSAHADGFTHAYGNRKRPSAASSDLAPGASERSSAFESSLFERVAALDDAEGIGSNNWVVSGARTASGKPLLANDPHLGLTTPSVWYFARLRAPGLEVFGATLPGVPYVLLGRNRNVAWGFTNTEPDVQDLYLERINPANADEYQTPQGYARFATRTERIAIRGEDAIDFVVRATRHGPVISDAIARVAGLIDGSRYVLALRWAALEEDDTTLAAVRAMNRARDAKEFEAALHGFGLAMQNAVFADVNGAIGFVAAGRVPVRRPDNDLKGQVPAPGWDPKYDWTGWLPYADVPRVINPPTGAVVTANHRITPPDYTHYLTTDWTLPYRADRITQLLDARPKHDPASFRAIQADVTSLAARDLLQALISLRPQPGTNAGKVALARLSGWDGTMRTDTAEPLIFHAWLRHLRTGIFGDDLETLAPELPAQTEMTRATLLVLRGETRARDWCDNRTTTEKRETCAEIASDALDAAAAELAQESGRDVLGLRWGEAHRAVHEHRPMSSIRLLRDWFELAVPAAGDTWTVNVGQLSLRTGDDWRAPYATRHGPGLRAIYDLAPGATGEWIMTTGEAGHPFSEHYGDLLQAWRNVQYRPITWDRPKSDPQPHKTLLLKPAPR